MDHASGHHLHPLDRLEANAPATWFLPRRNSPQARKRWIAGTLVPVGTAAVDSGAEQALRSGKSLLPAGVVALEGSFSRGDPVSIVSRTGRRSPAAWSPMTVRRRPHLVGRKIQGHRDCARL